MTRIEWTDCVWNPVTGCSKVSSGCSRCYAERIFPLPYPGRNFTDVRCHPERLREPLRWRRPRRVFVNSMSDLFHPSVPDGFLDQVFAVMARCPRHTFQVLTKRADRMRAYLSPQTDERISRGGPVRRDDHLSLPNVWLGVSVENQDCADERIPVLLATPAAVRFVSVEPLLGPVDLTGVVKLGMERGWGNATTFNALRTLRQYGSPGHPGGVLRDGLDWVIVGGESGPKARRCEAAWIRSVVNGCRERGVPVFVKQLGGLPVEDGQRILLQDPKVGDPSEWPGGLGIREYPEPDHG